MKVERNFTNYEDYKNYVKKQQGIKNHHFSIKSSTLILYLLFTFLTLFFLYKHIDHIPQKLKTITWDNSVGEIINVSIIDTGVNKKIRSNNHFKIEKVFNMVITFSYIDNNQYLVTFNKEEILGYKKVQQYEQKYFPHAKIKLKINPNNRADVIIKPNYLSYIILELALLMFILFFGIFLPFIVINNKAKDKENNYIDESQKRREVRLSNQEQLLKMQKIQELIYLIKKIHKLQ